MTTDERLAEIEKRTNRASPPHWPVEIWYGNEGGFAAIGPLHKSEYENDFESPDDENGLQAKRDAEFIAHAREDVPWLIAKVRELERTLGMLRAWIDAVQRGGFT